MWFLCRFPSGQKSGSAPAQACGECSHTNSKYTYGHWQNKGFWVSCTGWLDGQNSWTGSSWKGEDARQSQQDP